MQNFFRFPSISAFIAILIFAHPQILKAQITVERPGDTIGMNNVYELNIVHPRSYANNWEDVKITAVFRGSRNITINGFYFDTNLWKVRFAPPNAGKWSYAIMFTTPDSSYTDTGSFNCVPSTTKGFLQRHPNNQFRLIYPDGTLFNSIGFEDCMEDYNGNGTPLDDFGFDGGFYPDHRYTNLTNYMNAYGSNGAKFNLFRWTTNNCSFQLYDSVSTNGNAYSVSTGKFGDTLVRSLRSNGIRIWLTFFGPPVYNDIEAGDVQQTAAIERYISYVVARYGAYVDIWELFNESSATDYYYNTITAYIRSIDPFHRLISVSDERPLLACIDINSPHWYQKESVFDSDADAYNMITSRKAYNKPIIFGEQGNSVQNWDTLSSVRMRLRAWTSFFSEGTLIFWNTSYGKDYRSAIAANIYLGPTERSYIRALQSFTVLADSSASIIKITPVNGSEVRAYGLSTSTMTMGYFSHYNTHATNVTTTFTLSLKRYGTVYWINPADDSVIDSSAIAYGTQTLTSPPFNIDLAMRIKLNDNTYVFDDSQKLNVIIYPNPASSQFSIYGNFNGTAIVNLYNSSGEKVLTDGSFQNGQILNVSGLGSGLYIYQILSAGRIAAGKLVIKK